MNEPSFKKRYLIRLFVSLITPFVTLTTQILAPRALGPAAYGSVNFLTNFFVLILGFLETGTSIGFYTKLSQRQDDKNLVVFYLRVSLIICILMLLMVPISISFNLKEYFWPGQQTFFIYYAVILASLTWVSQVWNKIADAYALTVGSELARLASRFFGLIFILILFFSNTLNQQTYFFYNCAMTVFFSLLLIMLVQKSGHFQIKNVWSSSVQYKDYLIEFYKYSSPLFLYSLFSAISGVLDRWILQFFRGDIQQGYYSLSYQISALCFMFAGSMTPLLMREFAVAYGKEDLSKLGFLFRRLVPSLYSITSYFSCFVFFQSEAIAKLFGGTEFKGSVLTLSFMSLYPIHQTYGQLSGVLYYATNRTKLYSILGICSSVASSLITFFLIAPAQYGGLALGAHGLAFKMILLQFVFVNIMLYFNLRLMKLSFKYYIIHQIGSVLVLLALSFITKIFVDYFLSLEFNYIIKLFISGTFYSFLCIFICWNFPWFFGTNKVDLQNILQQTRSKLRFLSLTR